jgi:hypothetical protein
VNPSLEASGETSCFARPGKQVSDPLVVRATLLETRHYTLAGPKNESERLTAQ